MVKGTECRDLAILNGATLTITGTLIMGHEKTIFVKDNSYLFIDGGTIINANIVVEPGGTLIIDGDGTLILDANDNITIESGGLLEYDYGTTDIIN